MKSKNKSRSRRLLLVNTFGTLGYLSLLLQWAWTAIILLYPLLQSGAIQRMLTPKQPAKPIEAHPEYYSDAAPFIAAISVIITIAVIVISVVTILGLPKKIGKTGAKIRHNCCKTPAAQETYSKKVEIKFIVQTNNRYQISANYFASCIVTFCATDCPITTSSNYHCR